MNFKCKVTHSYKCTNSFEKELDPKDFLSCCSVHGLKWEVERRLTSEEYVDEKGDKRWKYLYNYQIMDTDLKLPEEFIAEWKKLLGMKPEQVINPKHAELRKKQSEYTLEIYGKEIGVYSRYRLIDSYEGYRFEDEKLYTCYMYDNDRDWAPVTRQIMYIEGC